MDFYNSLQLSWFFDWQKCLARVNDVLGNAAIIVELARAPRRISALFRGTFEETPFAAFA